MSDNHQPLPDLDDPKLYVNRELSWLEFNRRVLEEAQDPAVPLLERLKFLAIFSSNLDEFFMIRVAGLQQKVQAGITYGSGADHLPSREQLARISDLVHELTDEQYRCLHQEVLPQLEKAGIRIADAKGLAKAERKHLRELFQREIFPVLTPLAIDPAHPFPHLASRSLNLAVMLRRPGHEDPLFAVVQVPGVLPRFVPLPSETGHAFATLETAIRLHLPELFPGMELMHASLFRVIRDRDYDIGDDDVEDLLKTIEEELRKQRRGAAVCLNVEDNAPSRIVDFLMSAFDLTPQDVYRLPGILDPTGLFQICNLPGFPQLRDPYFVPQPVADFTQAANVWAAIRARDILVHHPYESFHHVLDFIETAAEDERVLAIKMTLYRSDQSIIQALQRAADNGKQVTALVEIKARMDEEKNIQWTREMAKAGVHVVYGFVGLKTHCKVCLVVRREEDGIRRYVHLATGNYNPSTARVYTDLGYFTCNPDFGEDVSALFNYLTGYSEVPRWRKLIVAPTLMQTFVLQRIEQEIAHQQGGRGGRIIAKINGLLEPAVVKALYRASQAGIQVDLICRGICALRPGLPGISDNVRVVSIVDRFLEHSRVFYFGNGGDPQVYIGSADWMDRNLSRRVEAMFPIEPPDLKKRLIDEVLATCLGDNVKARRMLPDGCYERVASGSEKRVRSQERFLELAVQSAERAPAEPGILAPALVPAGRGGDGRPREREAQRRRPAESKSAS